MSSHKRDLFEKLLAQDQGSGRVKIILDARTDAVVVPEQFKEQHNLCLEYGMNMPVPIADFLISDYGIEAILSFAREPSFTFVPWGAIYVIHNDKGEGVVFAESVPTEFELGVPSAPERSERPERRPGLRAVGEDEQAPEEHSAFPAYAGPPNLRLVN